MGASQCWNERPGFGLLSVSQKLRAYKYCKSFKHYKIKTIILYNHNIVLEFLNCNIYNNIKIKKIKNE